MNINELLNQLASDNSRIFKENLLKLHKDDDTLKRVVSMALDPMLQFYLRKIPDYVTLPGETETLEWALHRLSVLSSREKTGHAAIDHLRMVLSNINANDAKVIERVIEKDLKCGVSVSTVNKIWPKLIHEYPIMLASGFDQKLVDNITFPAVAQLKLDGMRANVVVENGKVAVFSRNGKPVDLLGHFDEAFLAMAEGQDMVFDGELMVTIPEGDGVEELSKSSKYKPLFMDRKGGNGICNKAVKGTISDKEASMIHIVLYDLIDDLAAWRKGIHKVAYRDRVTKLSDKLKKFPNTKGSLVDGKLVSYPHEAEEYFNEVFARGEEGIILKDLECIWTDTRSKGLIKFKGELEADLRVVGWEEGTGKNVGRLGALVIESEDGVIQTNVGTGFSDEQRANFTPENTIGKVVSIIYNARIKSKGDAKERLFLPRFIELREDKDKADSSKDIK